MSYKALIENNLRRAFILVKDLAIDVTFNKKPVSGFDFSTGDPIEGIETATVIKAVVIDNKKASTGRKNGNELRNVVKKQIMFKREDLGTDVTNYDYVTIGSDDWNLGQPIKDDGYIALIELYKEV
jgi:hypothetical protein